MPSATRSATHVRVPLLGGLSRALLAYTSRFERMLKNSACR